MWRSEFKYNPNTLNYEKVELGFKEKLFRALTYVAFSSVLAVLMVLGVYHFVDSPKEKNLKMENKNLLLQYEIVNKKLTDINTNLQSIQNKDDNIYRVIFEAEPISGNVRQAGIGGVDRYKDLHGYDHSDVIISTISRLDELDRKLSIQNNSLEEIYEMAKNKEKMLSSIPAIQPISNKNLTRMASGYGHRIHPIYKTKKMHWGMDFTAPTGTDIYATGNGVIKKVEFSKRGFGNHVIIDHGYGYETIYAHMNEINVKVGQKINRGDIIGFVGNSGTSTAPHLHYEVHKNGQRINPVNFYFNDLSPEEFERMIDISANSSQSFD